MEHSLLEDGKLACHLILTEYLVCPSDVLDQCNTNDKNSLDFSTSHAINSKKKKGEINFNLSFYSKLSFNWLIPNYHLTIFFQYQYKKLPMWFCLFWGQISLCIAQVGLKLVILLPQSPGAGCDWRGTKRLLALMSYFALLFELTSAGCWVPCNTPWLDWQHPQSAVATCGRGLSFWVAWLYTPNIHFPSPSSSNPVGTPLMTRVADDKPERGDVGCWGPQPLRHAPGSVTGVCVTTSCFFFSHWALSRHLGVHLAVLVLTSPEELPHAHMLRGRAQTGFPWENPSGLQSLRCQKALPCHLLVWNNNGHFPDVKQTQQSSVR